MTINIAADSPASRDDLIGQAKSLAAVFKSRCFEPESLGRVPEANIEAIRASGLTRIGVPAKFGGYDIDLETAFDCAIEIGRACGATAWIYSLYTSHLWWAGFHDLQLQEEIFANGPDVIIASVSLRRWNRVEKVAGGYRLSGHWMMSSGIDHAEWVYVLAEDEAGNGITMTVPTTDIAIIEDSWNVSGLQGTGSKDFTVDDVFVPIHRTVEYAKAIRGELGTPHAMHPQRRYAVPQGALQLWDLVSPAIGLAYAAVDEMTERLAGTSGGVKTADSTIVQARIAESATEADVARMLMRTDCQEAQDLGAAGGLSDLDMARFNRDKAYAVKLAVQSVNRMFDMAGGRALFKSDRMQLIHRDVQACMHRDKLLFEIASTNYGRALLGADFETA